MFKSILGAVAVTAVMGLVATPLAGAAPESPKAPKVVAASQAAAAPEQAKAPVHERGYVFFCTGERENGEGMIVDFYTNSAYTGVASVAVLGDDGEPALVSAPDSPSPEIKGGRVVADMPLLDVETREGAGIAAVRGTYRPSGGVIHLDDDFEDAGERIEAKGTNQHLDTDFRVRIDDEWVDLDCHADPADPDDPRDAFRFNLRVTKTPIV